MSGVPRRPAPWPIRPLVSIGPLLGCVMLAGLVLIAPALAHSPGAERAPGTERVQERVLPGPVRATVLDATDGDTLRVRARIWLGIDLDVRVRLSGIDAPELRGRCAAEREAALAARDLLARRLVGASVLLRDIRHDKYGGRVVARVEGPDGRDVSAALLETAGVRAYGRGPRVGWCGGP